jgi:trehalose 2-sulfotransferase
MATESLETHPSGLTTREKRPQLTCVICTFPRTGSTLLSHGLRDTGLAGCPTEYFGPTGEARFASEWGLPANYSLRTYLRAIATNTSTKNGVMAVKLMIPHLTQLLRRARTEFGEELSENELVAECFPNPKFIFLHRENLVRQAVSFIKAINTFQFESGQRPAGGTDPEAILNPDMSKITAYIGTFRKHERQWREFFERNQVGVHEIVYEELSADYPGVIFTALESLGIAPPPELKLPQPRLARQSDLTTERIVAMYAEYQSRQSADDRIQP